MKDFCLVHGEIQIHIGNKVKFIMPASISHGAVGIVIDIKIQSTPSGKEITYYWIDWIGPHEETMIKKPVSGGWRKNQLERIE